MEMVALATFWLGSVVGLRFSIIVLIPTILVAVTLITACALAQGATLSSIAVLNVVGAICLQFGYLGGVALTAIAGPRVSHPPHRPAR
jgi:hypothetical protein